MAELQSLNLKPAFRFSETSASRLNWGVIVLGFLSAVSAFVLGYFLKLFFAAGDWNFLWISFSAAVIFFAIFILNAFFVKSFLKNNLIALLSSLAVLAGFYDRLSLVLLVGALIMYIFSVWGIYSGARELENLIKIKFWRVSKKTLRKVAVGVLIFSSVAFYLSIKDLTWKNPGTFFVSAPVFEKIMSPVEPLIKKIVPEFGFNKTIDEFSFEVARNQINQNKNTQNLPDSGKELLALSSAAEMKNEISNLAGTRVDPQAKISDVIYEALLSRVINLSDQARSVFSYAVAAITFFAFYGFLWLFRWLATLISLLIYEIILALGLAVIMVESDNKEVAVFTSRRNY